MYVDKNLEFSDAQALTATAISANVYDLFTTDTGGSTEFSPNTRLDVGLGEDVWWIVSVPTTLAGGTATGITVTLETADDAALTTNAQVVATSGLIPVASLVSGFTLCRVKLPSFDYRRYLGVRYTAATGPFGSGNIDAFLTYEAIDKNRPYKSGFVVQ